LLTPASQGAPNPTYKTFPPYGSGADKRELRSIYIESRNATEDVPYRESREHGTCTDRNIRVDSRDS